MCKECFVRGKTWKGYDPICAFDEKGNLTDKGNWNCATLNDLREAILDVSDNFPYFVFDENFNDFNITITYKRYEDSHRAMIIFDGTPLYMAWYKSRGSTEYIYIHENYETSDEDFIISIIENLNKITAERKERNKNERY